MATGAGKTYTAVTQIYRLAKFSKVKRVLFLVDRGNLGRQALKEFPRWKSFYYDELMARDKANLDVFWLKDESLEDTENLPAPEILAQEIVEQLQAA